MSTETELKALEQAAAPEAQDEAPAIPKGYWADAKGNLIPIAKIKDIDKDRDRSVRALAAQAKRTQATLASFKQLVLAEVQDFLDRSAVQYGATMRGAAGKGNVTLTSFDGKYKVQRALQDSIAFGEQLQVAKAIIDERIHVWSKGANKNIQALVGHAFQVDSEGRVSVGRILSLKRLAIEDPEWKRAMDAITDSMKVVSSKTYIRLYERNDATGEYEPISLDLAAI